jgi:carbonic anhydrase
MLCKLNVAEQVRNVSRTTVVQHAWSSGQALSVHGVVYRIEDGLLHDLGLELTSPSDGDAVGRLVDGLAAE